jgi:hypothetical protein
MNDSSEQDDPRAMRKLTQLRAAFISKFGREPGPDDPLVFDPDAATPTPFPRKSREAISAAMTAAGTAPQIVYAYERTGLLLSKEAASKLPPQQLAEYRAAIEEYYALEYWKKTR